MDNLAVKIIIGFIQLIIGLGFMLFVPAGTFDFWQAWVYLFICGIWALLIFIYLYTYDRKLLERRMERREKEESQKHIQLLMIIAYVGIFILPSLDHRWMWSDVSFSITMGGDFLVVLGYFIMFFALKENTFAASTIEVAPDHKVISTGPYAIIRHPMYTGAIIMLLGTPLALGSWWGLLMVIPITSILVWRLVDEEKFLSQRLTGYKAYCQKFRYRLVPFIW